MGTIIIETKVDDLTGQPGPDVEKFEFVLDGVLYSMDACTETREAFREAVKQFTAVAKPKVLGSGQNSTEVRRWAKQVGYNVSDMGRLPDEVIEAYRQAHK